MSTPPIIGSKYTGPSFDRPALRQMPRHWTLEETRTQSKLARWLERNYLLSALLTAALLLALLVACAAAVRALV